MSQLNQFESHQSLFRPEAIAHKQRSLFGEINLAQPSYFSFWLFSAAFMLAMFFGFALFSELARKERVRGLLVPDQGIIHVTAQSAGRIESIHVQQGQKVGLGDRLFTVVRESQNSRSESLEQILIREIASKISLTEASMTEAKALYELEIQRVEHRSSELIRTLNGLKAEHALLKQRIQKQQEKLRLLTEENVPVARLKIMEVEDVLISMLQMLEQLDLKILQTHEQFRDSERGKKRLPLEHGQRRRAFQSQLADLNMRLQELKLAHRTVVRAPAAATVSALQTTPSQQLSAGDPLASLIAENSFLVASVFLPTKSAGLISLGDKVLLRFDAFPYQKYGQVEAKVIEIDQSLRRPDPHSQVLPDAMYQIRAGLSAQGIDDNGTFHPFKAGMLLEADVLLEKRRLLDWVLDPMLGFRRRFG